MAVLSTRLFSVAIPLLMCFGQVSGLSDAQVCYVLDGILFLYGVILTALYCKITIFKSKHNDGKPNERREEGIYTDLTPRVQDTYEVIGKKKDLK